MSLKRALMLVGIVCVPTLTDAQLGRQATANPAQILNHLDDA